MPDHKPAGKASGDIAGQYAAARAAQSAPPGPVDAVLEPLVWGIPGRWPYLVDRIRRGEVPATARPLEVARLLVDLHTHVVQASAADAFAPLTDSPLIEQATRIWDVVKADLGKQTAWLAGLGPDDPVQGSVTQADFAVAVGQWMQAGAFQTLERRLSDLDYLRGYTAQMRADWRPFAQAHPGHELTLGPAVARYNWLLDKARKTVVKQRQHVDNLDEFDLDTMARSAAVLDYSLIQLLRALAFA